MWILRHRFAIALTGLFALAGCSVFGPDLTFDESVQDARDMANVVAAALGDPDRVERVTIGPLTCGGSNRYANLTGYLPLDPDDTGTDNTGPGEPELDAVADAIAPFGYSENSREDFAVGPYRLWDGPDNRTISVTIVADENAVRIWTTGRCAQPPD
jgi:hypothetical protein